jgi:hypothetical protein
MTKEALEKRLREIENAIEQTLANYNVMLGGKQEILYWLDQLSKNDIPLEVK